MNKGRRDFLKLLGFSIGSAAVAASCRRPVINALPYAIQPPEITPGKSLYYASTFFDGHEYSGILVKTREGRPIKIEPNNLSAFSGQGTTARVQASVLSLYDDSRLKFPTVLNKRETWETVDAKISDALARINNDSGEIVLLTPTIISPSTKKLIGEFGAGFKKFRWVQYDAVSHSAISESNYLCFGRRVIPDYHFGNASLVVSVNADFLGTWLAPAHFIQDYSSSRDPGRKDKKMLRHIQFESGMTVTGANADRRIKIKPSEEKLLLSDLYNRISQKTGSPALNAPGFREDLSWLAESLIAAKGKSIVVSGTNNTDIQVLVNGINHILGNYNNCIDLASPVNLFSGKDDEMDRLADDLESGNVKALLMYNVNPVYDYPTADRFVSGLRKADLSVNMTVAVNDSTGLATYECPVSHFLESWDDAEIVPGQLSLAQPCINPLYQTRSFQDSLLKWSGSKLNFHDYLQGFWEKNYFTPSAKSDFRSFWEESLRNGVHVYTTKPGALPAFSGEALAKAARGPESAAAGAFEVIISESVALGNGVHSNNPWLMELPDPVTRHCWENVASMSKTDADKLGIITGDVLILKEGFELPVFVQRGQAEGTISVAMGYGHKQYGPVGRNGVNMFPLVRITGGNREYSFLAEKPVKSLKKVVLALSQVHESMEGRPIVRDTLLSEFKKDPSSGNELHKEFETTHRTLYPDVKYDGFHWGMAIDLSLCVGCNACVIACQAENNVPVVGKEEVFRRRIMHWIRIDRYYSENKDDPKVYFQPLACQHCDNAPCENVCPVSATNHSTEGLNQVAYNRCVGTKYCINNCPYRVRRFNWFRYTNNKVFDYNSASDLGKMVLNPDVTVRERGVVEKCSFCVQRIQEKKLQAKLEKRVLRDTEIKPACMQACPAGAIVFGNLNDPDSRVSQLFRDPRCYHLLEELHTLPNTGYLTKVRNDEESTV